MSTTSLDLTSFAALSFFVSFSLSLAKIATLSRQMYFMDIIIYMFLIFNDPSCACASGITDRNSDPMQSLWVVSHALLRVACNAFIRRVIICTGYIAKHHVEWSLSCSFHCGEAFIDLKHSGEPE